jgi:phage antirepressor YoqD-like protein
LEALEALVASEKEKQLLLADNQVMAAKIDLDAPLVSYANAVEATDDAISFNAFAKMINTGRTRLFRQMRDCGVILKDSTLPYQKWVDAGYFEVSQTIETIEGKLIPFALVTGKGQLWLHQRLQKAAWLEKVEESKQTELPFDNI